jgi:hypothetical protein
MQHPKVKKKKILYTTSNTRVFLPYTGTVSMVGRKRHSPHKTGHEPEVKIKRNRSTKPEQQTKRNKTNNGTFKKDSKGVKTAGK